MEWAAATRAVFWGTGAAASDAGPTMLSFAGPSSSRDAEAEAAAAAAAAAAALQDFSAGLAHRASSRPHAPSSRRARGGGGSAGGGADSCSVDGCRSDLTRCRDYHRRHKVCEAHAKTPVVVVGGLEQRFCQQCSRFHNLGEFDDEKKSCRKRLDGHNRRRRKPQHDALNPRSFIPYQQVNQFSVYPQTFPIADQNGDASMRPLDRQPTFSISFSGSLRAPKQFPFLQDSSSSGGISTAGQNLLRTYSSAEDGANITPTRSSTCNGVPHGLDPECALSLLSSSLHPSSAGISSTTPPAQFAPVFSRIASSSQTVTTAFASDGPSVASHHVLVPTAAYEDPSQALPFSWQV